MIAQILRMKKFLKWNLLYTVSQELAKKAASLNAIKYFALANIEAYVVFL